MTTPTTPKNGDFASYLEAGQQTLPASSSIEEPALRLEPGAADEQPRQTIQQVIVDGEEPTEEFLEEWNALKSLPEISDEELAQQALSDPGADGDIHTPE